MNAITKRSGAPELPAVSPALARVIAALAEPIARYAGAGDDAQLVINRTRAPTLGEIEEAIRILPDFEGALAPAPRERVERWLRAIAGGVANPPTQDAFMLRLAAISIVVGDAPASCWSSDTLNAGLSRWKFLPSASEVAALVDETANPLRRQLAALRRIARTQPGQQPPPTPRRASPTEADREAVASLIRSWKSEIADRRLG